MDGHQRRSSQRLQAECGDGVSATKKPIPCWRCNSDQVGQLDFNPQVKCLGCQLWAVSLNHWNGKITSPTIEQEIDRLKRILEVRNA